MSAASEYELIPAAVNFLLAQIATVENQMEDWLQTHADTPAVNRLRTLGMARAMVAVGAFSLFEALLQQKKGWTDTFDEADVALRSGGRVELADRLLDFRAAINVLKHGQGRSYEALLARQDRLDFAIKQAGQRYFDEGDITEGLRLIHVDDEFVRQCTELVTDVVQALRT